MPVNRFNRYCSLNNDQNIGKKKPTTEISSLTHTVYTYTFYSIDYIRNVSVSVPDHHVRFSFSVIIVVTCRTFCNLLEEDEKKREKRKYATYISSGIKNAYNSASAIPSRWKVLPI